MAFPRLGNSDHVAVSVFIDFPSYSQHILDYLRDNTWEDVFKLSASAAASEFCGWVQVAIDIPHRKYQVKPHSSPWFSADCAAAKVYRNHFFHLYQKDKSSESKVKHMLIKWKSPSLSKNLALRNLGELPIVFSTKVNLLNLLYLTAQRFCLLHMIKQNYLLKTFLRTLILITQVTLYLVSLEELIWNCIIFL